MKPITTDERALIEYFMNQPLNVIACYLSFLRGYGNAEHADKIMNAILNEFKAGGAYDA